MRPKIVTEELCESFQEENSGKGNLNPYVDQAIVSIIHQVLMLLSSDRESNVHME